MKKSKNQKIEIHFYKYVAGYISSLQAHYVCYLKNATCNQNWTKNTAVALFDEW